MNNKDKKKRVLQYIKLVCRQKNFKYYFDYNKNKDKVRIDLVFNYAEKRGYGQGFIIDLNDEMGIIYENIIYEFKKFEKYIKDNLHGKEKIKAPEK